jgi:tRNA(Ile)-lysidine synthase
MIGHITPLRDILQVNMKDLLLKNVKDFLKIHYRPPAPLLLGFSGGPDSTALLHLLRATSTPFHLAHVDHGWRESSAKEAQELQALASRLGIPFHLKVVDSMNPQSGDLENRARELRLNFFSTLVQEGGFQALLLAHQADDQAETVLKRVLEGSSLFALHGLQAVSMLRGMQVWRPLLGISKADLTLWLEKRGVIALEDPSNSDPRFLRSRMRQRILPQLEKEFGKQVRNNLLRLAEESSSIAAFIEKKLPPLDLHEIEGGIVVDFRSLFPLTLWELDQLLKLLFKQLSHTLSYRTRQNVAKALFAGSATKSFPSLYVDKGKLFFSPLSECKLSCQSLEESAILHP